MFGYGECGWARPEFVVDDATPVRGKVVVLDELGGHPVQQRSGERGVDPRPVRLDVGAQLGQFPPLGVRARSHARRATMIRACRVHASTAVLTHGVSRAGSPRSGDRYRAGAATGRAVSYPWSDSRQQTIIGGQFGSITRSVCGRVRCGSVLCRHCEPAAVRRYTLTATTSGPEVDHDRWWPA